MRGSVYFAVHLLAFLTLLPNQCVLGQPETGSDSELWYGVLETPNRHFRFSVQLTAKDEAWSGELVSYDEGKRKFELPDLNRNAQELSFSIRGSSGKFSGNMNQAGTVADGFWLQGAAKLPLKFTLVESIPEQKLTALWKGEIDAFIQKLEIQMRELEDGTVYFDSIGQKVGGFLAEKTLEENDVTFIVDGLKSKLVGTLSEDGETIEGKWQQNFLSPSVTLKKVAITELSQTSEVVRRPQTPKAPFPYESHEVLFENDKANIRLSGTLTIPQDAKHPLPAVILVSGSGPQDRDETILEHKPFWVIADYFTRQGIAVLRYDDRGVAKSEGEFLQATSRDLADDAQAAWEFLAAHPKIDSSQIGICGHSEGGLIGPMVAAENSRIGFLILMAGPGVRGDKILSSQTGLILTASGLPKDQVEKEVEKQKALLRLATARPLPERAEFLRQASETIHAMTPGLQLDAPERAAFEASIDQLLTPSMQYFLTFDPQTSLAKVHCPTLAINGTRDLQIDPALNLPAIESALSEAPTQVFDLVELPNLNHLFQNCQTGLMDEYGEIEETFDPQTLELMSAWIRKHTSLE